MHDPKKAARMDALKQVMDLMDSADMARAKPPGAGPPPGVGDPPMDDSATDGLSEPDADDLGGPPGLDEPPGAPGDDGSGLDSLTPEEAEMLKAKLAELLK